MPVTGSVLFHVQWLLGIGHLQRTLRIVEALAGDGVAVTLACGGPPVSGLAIDSRVRVVQLPAITARDAGFELVDAAGQPLDDARRAARREALLAAFTAARPGVVVIEGFPFARRAFRFELDPLIAAAHAAGAPVVCSVRDVIVMRDDPVRRRQAVARVRDDFAAVMVHGDPGFIPFAASFPLAHEIAGRLIYTGYVTSVAEAELSAPDTPQGEVVVSAGGGGVAGRRLMAAALAARRAGCLAATRWRLLTGTALPEAEFAALCREASAGVIVERFRRDFPVLLRRCRVSVSQAGYNTALDLIAARVPAVLVPFAEGNETEQAIRAEYLAARGVAELVRESELTPHMLAAAIERAVARPPAALAIETGGARRSAGIIAGLLGAGGSH
ncbi:MAG: glycosyltransferase family protein [Stellaceae bacterium]